MSDENDRTIIQPGSQPEIGGGSPPTPSEADRTIIAPAGNTAPPSQPPPSHDATIIAPASAATSSPSSHPATVIAPAQPSHTASTSPRAGTGITVGDTLNHIYEVTRFIARGGMGEVFEGKNINSDERVAIKVILPALAQDPAVLDMFRKEARVLTRLSHPALVQYRVQTREPTLDVFYIVTDYIEGANVADVLGKIQPTAEELIGLTRRLAAGLGAAHELGAIHRDISPDNILLEGGRLDRARIIDFGIAKDADPGSKTVIGDGFAGKLSYVAPEQLGDFGRNIGPWTDVYSLALVILALAQGKAADIGGSFVDAIDKRRKGIDTSAAPAALRPLLDDMLQPDPAQRPQSMDAVLAQLDGRATPAAAKPAPGSKAPKPALMPKADAKPLPKGALIGGGAAAGVAVLAGIGWLAFGGGGGEPTVNQAAPAVPVSTASIGGVQQAVAAAIKAVPCSWIDVATTGAGSGVSLVGSGVAGQPSAAETAIYKAAGSVGTNVARSDFARVAPIDASFCPLLDNLRPIRAAGPTHLTASQPRYELAALQEGDYAGQKGARVILDLNLENVDDFALYSIEKAGEVNQIFDRATFNQLVSANRKEIEKLPGTDHYRLTIDGTPQPGWAGMLLLTGKGGFVPALPVTGDSAAFKTSAQKNGWQAEMAWYRFVDDAAN